MKFKTNTLLYGLFFIITTFAHSYALVNPNKDLLREFSLRKITIPHECCEAIKNVVEMLSEKNYHTEVLLGWYQRIIDGKKTISIQNLLEIFENLSTIVNKYLLNKAMRPDAPTNTSGVVGSMIDCDFEPIINLLNLVRRLLSDCCQTLQFQIDQLSQDVENLTEIVINDFASTFTLLNELQRSLDECCQEIADNFNGTFTTLTDIKNTVSSDFINTWTILANLKETLTACCENIQIDFNAVFTSIAAVDLDFNSVFTTISDVKDSLTACCGAIQNNFNGTFTALNEVSNEVINLNSTLTACCQEIADNFNGTFTSLIDIKNTVSSDFINTWTILTNLKETITTCCESIQVDFNAVFTSIAAADLDFNSVFTAISDVKDTLTACCEATQNNFNGTFTVLNGIVSDLAGTQTALDTCCAEIQEEFTGTFTMLDVIFQALLLSTGITLGSIDQVQQSILACKATVITAPTTINAPGAYCLSHDIVGTVIINADDVYFELGGNTIFDGGIVIQNSNGVNVKGGIIDNALGAAAVRIINSSNVTLSGLTIIDATNDGVQCDGVTGLFMQSFAIANAGGDGIQFLTNISSAVIIQDFSILNSTGYAFNFTTNMNTIMIKNGTITGGQGIHQNAALTMSRLSLYNLTITSITNASNYALEFLGILSDAIINNIQLMNPIGGFHFVNLINTVLKNCTIKDIIPSAVGGTIVDGIRVDLGSSIQCDSCNVDAISDGVNLINFNGFVFRNVVNILCKSCVVQKIVRQTALMNGFLFDTCDSIQIMNSTVQTMQSVDLGQQASGFNFLDSTQAWINNCTASECSSSGFVLQGTSDHFTFNQCFSLYNAISTSGAHGFEIPTGGTVRVSMQYCQADSNDGNGFEGGSGVVIGKSVATNNAIGFNGNTAMLVYNSFATGNGINYNNLSGTSPVQLIGATPVNLGANIDA